MKTKYLIITSMLLMVSLLMASGCDETIGKKGSGHVTTENRAVKPFHEIDIEGIFPIEIHQDGGAEWVKVETDDNLQSLIKVSTEGGKLSIGMSDHVRLRSSDKMKVIVNVRDVDRIVNKSVGPITTSGKLSFDSLEINSESVGKMDFELHGNYLKANLKAVGSTAFSGAVTEVRINNKSIGALHAYDLKAQTLMIHNTAVGSAEVYADSAFYIRSSAIGTLHYKGPGAVVELSSEGIGKVSRGE